MIPWDGPADEPALDWARDQAADEGLDESAPEWDTRIEELLAQAAEEDAEAAIEEYERSRW